jgi:hypothetical protein
MGGVQRAPVHTSVDRAPDEARLLKHPDVSRNCRQRHREGRREVGNFPGPTGETGEQRPPGAVRQRMEHEIELIVRT